MYKLTLVYEYKIYVVNSLMRWWLKKMEDSSVYEGSRRDFTDLWKLSEKILVGRGHGFLLLAEWKWQKKVNHNRNEASEELSQGNIDHLKHIYHWFHLESLIDNNSIKNIYSYCSQHLLIWSLNLLPTQQYLWY